MSTTVAACPKVIAWLLGSYALNPVNQEAVPIWVADYVLSSYGSGAIMAVPAHDTRDFEFAQQFGLPMRQVVRGPAHDTELPYTGQWLGSKTVGCCAGPVAEHAHPLR